MLGVTISNLQLKATTIDESSHAFLGLGNEVSKEAMHVSTWSCMRVICIEERMRKKFMVSEW